MTDSVLVEVSGEDHPGVTAALMELITAAAAAVTDVEQITIHGRLHLSMLIRLADSTGLRADPDHRDLLKELLLFGWENDYKVHFDIVDQAPLAAERRLFAVTLLGQDLTAAQIGAAAAAIANAGGNIERITCLARYPATAYELSVSATDVEPVRRQLIEASRTHFFDVAVQRDGLIRRAMRLVALDVDSTLIQDEVVDLLAAEAGCESEVAAITASAMAGELDFAGALYRRVELLAGLDEAAIERARARLRLTPGARTFVRTLQRLGFKIALVSGGFTTFTERLRAELGVDHAFANELEMLDGRLTGRLIGPIVDRDRKAVLLREVADLERISLSQTVAVGDGANDLDMLAAAGLGIAFNAKPLVAAAADAAVNLPYLDAILFVLGIRRGDVDEADAEVQSGNPW